MYNYPYAMSEEEILGNIKIPIGKAVAVDKPARLIIRFLFGFASDSVFDKFNQYTGMLSGNIPLFLSLQFSPTGSRVLQ